MNIVSHLLSLLLCMAITAPAAATETLTLPAFATEPTHCLMFTVDGLDRDFITSETTPNLYAWKNAGAELPDAINVFPTATTPNMSSLYSGAFPSRTGVGGNLVFRKAEKRYQVGPRPRNVTSLNDAFTSAGYSTAGVQIYMMDKAHHYLRVNGSKPRDVTTMSLSLLTDKTSVPILMAVLFETVDKVSHRYGPDTQEARAEAATVDHEIATIVRRYGELGLLQNTMVLVTADHGMSATDHVIDQGKVNDAVTSLGLKYEWLTRPGQSLNPNVDLYLMLGGNLLGYFNRDFSDYEQQRLFSALQQVEGLSAAHDTITLRRMNAHPSGGDFVIEPAAGWRFRGNRGTHGTNRESDGYQTFFGAGVNPGTTIKGARTVDIMPTILEAFGIEIPENVDGKPLKAALK